MQKLTFVIGATASGKTYFINHQFAGDDVKVLIKKFTPQEHRIALSVKDINE